MLKRFAINILTFKKRLLFSLIFAKLVDLGRIKI